jgi:hypothetical protein
VVAGYYSHSGSYTGNASSFTHTGFALNADGTFSRSFASSQRGGPLYAEKSDGTWTVEDDALVLRPKGGKIERQRIWGIGTNDDGPTLILGPADQQPDLVKPGWAEGETYHPDTP